MKTCRSLFLSAVIMGLLCFAGEQTSATAGTVSYEVTAYSSGLTTSAGFVEFAMSPGTAPSTASVTATITDFLIPGGAIGAAGPPIGDVSGSLSSPPLILDNATYSDAQQAITYGTSLSFVLTLSGSDVGNPNAPSGTDFSIMLEDSTGNGLYSGPAGQGADFYFPPLAGMTYETYAPTPTGLSYLFITPYGAVPEPSSMIMLGVGVAGMATYGSVMRRRRSA